MNFADSNVSLSLKMEKRKHSDWDEEGLGLLAALLAALLTALLKKGILEE